MTSALLEKRASESTPGHTLTVVGFRPEIIRWDPTNLQQLNTAQMRFTALQEQHCLMSRLDGPETAEQIDTFDPEADILAVPPLAGG